MARNCAKGTGCQKRNHAEILPSKTCKQRKREKWEECSHERNIFDRQCVTKCMYFNVGAPMLSFQLSLESSLGEGGRAEAYTG